jgi:hypothetical protein
MKEGSVGEQKEGCTEEKKGRKIKKKMRQRKEEIEGTESEQIKVMQEKRKE